VQDPSELYAYETDTPLRDLRASVLLVSLGGFVDAGQTQRLMTDHVLATLPHTVVASFDVDQLIDYRGRRPSMMFDRDRWASYAAPTLLLYRVTDADGEPSWSCRDTSPTTSGSGWSRRSSSSCARWA